MYPMASKAMEDWARVLPPREWSLHGTLTGGCDPQKVSVAALWNH
jgi:hypothetical protein